MANGVERIPSPEGLAAPPSDYQSWDEYMLDVEAVGDARTADRFERAVMEGEAQRRADYEANREISLRMSKAMELAPNLAVFQSLMAGEQVARSLLDQRWVKRYRL